MTSAKKPGFESALQALRGLSPAERSKLLETMSQTDPELVEQLRSSLMEFADLINLSPEQIRTATEQVTDGKWALSLRNASDELKAFILGQFTKRRSEAIIEMMSDMGPQPLSKVEEAQAEILALVMKP